MPKAQSPRHGSMQYWPRKRAKRQYPRVRSWISQQKPGLLGFPGYKAGMTHFIATDTSKHSQTKGEDIFYPATVLECPPIKILAVRLYQEVYYSKKPVKEFMFKPDKELGRKLPLPRKVHDAKELDSINPDEYTDITILAYTQPRLTGKKKKPELFELHLGGTGKDKLEFAKVHIGKDITIKEVFEEGNLADIHGITKGKGYQGPVKRFGIAIRHHKSEKTKRGPGSLGGWSEQGHVMYRVAHAGQMGYHQRVEHNKQIMKISQKPEEINPKGDFLHYGKVRNEYILVKGSVIGPAKRMVLLTKPFRQRHQPQLPVIQHISQASKQ